MTDRGSSHTSATFEQALKNWQQAGIITREQADAISAFESGGIRLGLSPDAPRAPVTPSTLITYIGGFLVLVASGVFVGLGWADMGNAQRFSGPCSRSRYRGLPRTSFAVPVRRSRSLWAPRS